jgi:two-component system sensor histidine kinase TctE
LQRRFVADAAHQLRTPVAGIRVLAGALGDELSPAAGAELRPSGAALELLAQLGRSTERLSRLIGQLLSLARSETALASDVPLERLDLGALVRDVAEPFALRAVHQDRQFSLEAPGSVVWARTHPIWLGEVLSNLLDNALRYGGYSIQLRVFALPEGVACVQVEDDGPGVSGSELGQLFQPFWRGPRADLRNDGGTGLGLTIAKEVMSRLGGNLLVATRPEVDGLRFTLRLPA